MAVRALIAAHSRIVLNAIRLHLECVGCDVVAEVETVAQVLALFKTVKPDVVMFAIDPPGTDHIDPISCLRAVRAEAPKTTIILLGGDQGKFPRQEVFLREGALYCISRPFGSASFDLLWRRLSEAYPELQGQGFSAIMSNVFQQRRSHIRAMA